MSRSRRRSWQPQPAIVATALALALSLVGSRTEAQPHSAPSASLRAHLAFGDVDAAGCCRILNEELLRSRASQISFDKVQHVTFGFLFTVGHQYMLVNKLEWSENSAVPVSATAAVAVGVAKEVYDWKRGSRREFSEGDLLADVIGVVLATGLILL